MGMRKRRSSNPQTQNALSGVSRGGGRKFSLEEKALCLIRRYRRAEKRRQESDRFPSLRLVSIPNGHEAFVVQTWVTRIRRKAGCIRLVRRLPPVQIT
jgi:hypothetical protein